MNSNLMKLCIISPAIPGLNLPSSPRQTSSYNRSAKRVQTCAEARYSPLPLATTATFRCRGSLADAGRTYAPTPMSAAGPTRPRFLRPRPPEDEPQEILPYRSMAMAPTVSVMLSSICQRRSSQAKNLMPNSKCDIKFRVSWEVPTAKPSYECAL
jgi:hypothetical protein